MKKECSPVFKKVTKPVYD